MRLPITLWALLFLALSAQPTLAHHSFAAFDMKKELTLKGTVSEVQYTNPHGWVFIDVTTAKGGVETWAFETGGPAILLRQGWMKNTVKVGQKVEVVFHPMRDARKKGGALKSITLPDGKIIEG